MKMKAVKTESVNMLTGIREAMAVMSRRVCASPLRTVAFLVRQAVTVLIAGPALLAGLMWLAQVAWFCLDGNANLRYWQHQADAWQNAPRGQIMQPDYGVLLPPVYGQEGAAGPSPSVFPEKVTVKAVPLADHARQVLASDAAVWKALAVLSVFLHVMWALAMRISGGAGCRAACATVTRQANGTLHVVYRDGRQTGEGKGRSHRSLLHRYPSVPSDTERPQEDNRRG